MHDHAAAGVWADPAARAATLFILGADRYGPEACHFQPETWLRDIYDDCRVKLADGNLSRLMAACALFPDPADPGDDRDFYARPRDFEFLCRMYNSAPGFRVQYGELADAEDVAWGVTEALLIRPPDHDFAPAVKRYAALACAEAGCVAPPKILRIAGLVGPAAPPADFDAADTDHVRDARGRAGATREIDAHVARTAGILADQLDALKLREGNAGKLAAKVRRLATSWRPSSGHTPPREAVRHVRAEESRRLLE